MKRAFIFSCAIFFALSCNDPVHDAEVDALGPEDPNVPKGELHRPGQPCLLCHDNFSAAGTVFSDDLTTPFPNAVVTLIDAVGNQTQATTNAAGNFFVLTSDWKPVFPIGSYTDSSGNAVVGVSIVGNDPKNPANMLTHIGRDASCASCHFGSGPSAASPGPVYVTTGTP